jgi:hypothetical protein
LFLNRKWDFFGEETEATPEILQFLFSQAGTLRGYQVLKKNIPFATLGIFESSMKELSVSKRNTGDRIKSTIRGVFFRKGLNGQD